MILTNVNCPTCNAPFMQAYAKEHVKQKYTTETCKNGHDFLLDYGGSRKRTMAITYDPPHTTA